MDEQTVKTREQGEVEAKLREGIEGLRAYVASVSNDWYTTMSWACPLSRWLSTAKMQVSVNYVGALLLVQGVDVDVEVLLSGEWADFVRQFDDWATTRTVTAQELLRWIDQIYYGG